MHNSEFHMYNSYLKATESAREEFHSYRRSYPGPLLAQLSTCPDRDRPSVCPIMDLGSLHHRIERKGRQQYTQQTSASCFSKFTMSWMNTLFKLGAKDPLLLDDVPPLPATSSIKHLNKVFVAYWKEELTKATPSVFRAIQRTLKPQLIHAFLCHSIYIGLNLIMPSMIQGIIQYLEDKAVNPVTGLQDKNPLLGYLYAGGLSLLTILSVTLLGYSWSINIQLSNHARSILMDAVFAKALQLNLAGTTFTPGDILTFSTVDTERVFHGLTCVCYVVLSPLALLIVFLMISKFFGGYAAFAGALTMFLFLGSAFLVSKWIAVIRTKLLEATSARMTHTQEILQGIRVVKLYAWEPYLKQSLARLRHTELRLLRVFQLICNINIDLFVLAPIFTTVAIFAVALSFNQTIRADETAAVVSLMVVARFPCNIFSSAVRYLSEARVSCNRIQEFLLTEQNSQLQGDLFHFEKPMLEGRFEVRQGSFTWQPQTTTVNASNSQPGAVGATPSRLQFNPQPETHQIAHLHNINLKLVPESLTVIVGAVGSGKSSLIRALLGDMPQLQGTRNIRGIVAYASQEPWLQQDTIRNNIVLNQTFSTGSYNRVTRVCGLHQDFKAMAQGDLEEVGERGSTLSGGQRARVNLARALYRHDEADLFLLDDPLSALDVLVANQVFEGIRNVLEGKTVVMVLNAHHHLLPFADRILVMAGGTIVGDGTYASLQEKHSFPCLKPSQVEDAANEKPKKESNEEDTFDEEDDEGRHSKLMMTEQRATGSVVLKIFRSYFLSSGFPPSLVCLALMVSYTLYQAAYYLTDWFLNTRITDGNGGIFTYLGLACVTVLLSMCKDMFVIYISTRCSMKLHEGAVTGVLGASITSFFDRTPLGSILNRFSSDISAVDTDLPYFGYQFLTDAFHTLNILIVIAYFTPFMMIVFIPFGYFFVSYQIYCLKTANEVKRLDLGSRSQVISLLTDVLDGQSTIRAYGHHVHIAFVDQNRNLCDINSKCYYTYWLTGSWLEIRLGWLSALILTGVAFVCVIFESSLDPKNASLVLIYVMSLSSNIQEVLRAVGYVQTYMTCVERLLQYQDIEPEGNTRPKTSLTDRELQHWPQSGLLKLQNYSMRYRKSRPLALTNLTFTVASGEHIGICGRTGSGKSSLLSALCRMVEGESGAIYFDNVNIETIPLHVLRSRLTVIPQNPILFTGSFRFNLDPTGLSTDDQLHDVLKSVHLENFGLDFIVEESGTNVSVGQRQLVCIARALLRKSRVVILDEATAHVDGAAEALLQETLKTVFNGVTTLTIAHRLDTIIDSDRILVLDRGTVAEFETPKKLLADTSSIFYNLVKQASS